MYSLLSVYKLDVFVTKKYHTPAATKFENIIFSIKFKVNVTMVLSLMSFEGNLVTWSMHSNMKCLSLMFQKLYSK